MRTTRRKYRDLPVIHMVDGNPESKWRCISLPAGSSCTLSGYGKTPGEAYEKWAELWRKR